mmetsp:Transcript_5815/g.17198  ORF Transcript_5815/g.17198 Transcript_5815/m.17198 type:complete len:173 (-) Transcript_5815:116-634(-)|eukprot:CAMPEP_0198525506 /NCGR_PEP_ID=MMETSP1462-20131121/23398_1 /TAXON_ID=1333877 /ORGANISM="Brandtodinium nutriculum, Strain RCC3387" /LENGTH=172 /DNA_ID=CAMNT_0044255259 /DNA_START=68 /DNA_END=586 /DNA_ORIENTATION=-
MAGLDSHASNLQMELIRKEESLRWNHPSNAAKRSKSLRTGGEAVLGTPRQKPGGATPRSAAMRFLEEKSGLVPTSAEYSEMIDRGEILRPETRELIYHGTSSEGKGRLQYLQERRKYGVIERHGMPVTFAQTYGLSSPDRVEYVASPNCKKPIIQQSFFRPMGIATHKDLPE